jgi:midasin (ATPase involved in ribosome maturation)
MRPVCGLKLLATSVCGLKLLVYAALSYKCMRQAFAAALGNKLHIVNCHQNTETSDLIGGFRPIRGKQLKASYTSSLRLHTLVAEGLTR